MNNNENKEQEAPSKEDSYTNLSKIICDMMQDLLTTFPELKDDLDKNLHNIINAEDKDCVSIKIVQKHCEAVFPERFFDILYQNEDIFSDTKTNTEFLPNVNFSKLWKENITDNTKQSIWKYLQVMLFSVVSNVSDQKSFGDTAKLFEAINQDEFKKKLEHTITEMQSIFMSNLNSGNTSDTAAAGTAAADTAAGAAAAGTAAAGAAASDDKKNTQKTQGMFPGMENLPDPKELQDHISTLMDGKLGSLAKEIAEETAKDMNIDMTNSESVNDVFQKLFKQPTKLMSLVKNVGTKLDEKMKSGDIKESELLEEANSIMQKMKDMPGMGNMKDLFSKMGMSGKMNMGATEANIKRNMKGAQQRDRMREKLARRQEARDQDNLHQPASNNASRFQEPQLRTNGSENGIENKVFSTGESYEKSEKRPGAGNKKKKRKNKNKK